MKKSGLKSVASGVETTTYVALVAIKVEHEFGFPPTLGSVKREIAGALAAFPRQKKVIVRSVDGDRPRGR